MEISPIGKGKYRDESNNQRLNTQIKSLNTKMSSIGKG